jgi:hypothetical protein
MLVTWKGADAPTAYTSRSYRLTTGWPLDETVL